MLMEELRAKLNEVGPSQGTYVLVFLLDQPRRIKVGRLGNFTFKPGTYLYTGSALGPGGLSGRIHRHLRPESQKRSHWHIDALASKGSLIDIWWSTSPRRQECAWGEILSMAGDRSVPGFGASDCRCAGHLVWLQDAKSVDRAWDALSGHVSSNLHRVNNTETTTF
jgi:Uri superfamily endonuclease